MADVQALLVRLPAGVTTANTRGLAATGVTLEPLFVTRMPAGKALGVASGAREWYIARPRGSTDGANAWDLAHDTLAQLGVAPGFAAAGPDLVEPDLLQDWLPERPPARLGLAASDPCAFDDQNRDWPVRDGEFAWHLTDAFSQLNAARTEAEQHAAIARIVHLDTGYDVDHATFPADQIELALQRNFVEDNNDARDPGIDGTLKNPGHGTGTLSILAGGPYQFTQSGYQFNGRLGGTSKARIVPVRVGNSVVQIRTSQVAKGIDYAVELCANPSTAVHVVSMSMGGVASAVWADAVNKAYEAGIVFVAAAGNNVSAGFFGFPTHQIVYPARFRRVIAACGVMADLRPYYGLRAGMMQGNWGPQGTMATALSAFTPNVSWARWGCAQVVRMNGEGTSSATPQIAAAAALYIQAHADELFDPAKYPEPWMRIEAVRRALFLAADKSADGGSSEKLGNGVLRAAAALGIAPPDANSLHETPPDRAGFPFLNVLSRTGLAPSASDQMLQLEATQLLHTWNDRGRPNPLEAATPDPDRRVSEVPAGDVRDFLEGVRAHGNASTALKQRAGEVLDRMSPDRAHRRKKTLKPAAAVPTQPVPFVAPEPAYRRLRSYAVDPSLTKSVETVSIGEVTFKLPWEPLAPGPVGEYLEVVDIDPASNAFYEPINLDDPKLLAQDGLPPSEGVPQFHQQMVYAVCSLTIRNFETALGRPALWRPQPNPDHPYDDSRFVQRLRVYPHALREANAYYSPDKIALLFGYFDAVKVDASRDMPGGRVFTCLSHDIVAHETTHALLDGMHRKFLRPSNPDVLAFHEGFADCVAMLQHFTFPELVAHQIATTRGSIDSQENMLLQLAVQFGRNTGNRTALRDAIGTVDDRGSWRLRPANVEEYKTTPESHDRGRILVSAVFDAFLSIYKRRTADLVRLATEGTGILRAGAIHPDLVNRMAAEAAKSAQHVLTMCIRALDYCPPIDITFGEYLRAIITADHDMVADDKLNYRVAFIEAFQRRGIYPHEIRTMSVESLIWRSLESGPAPSSALQQGLVQMREADASYFYVESRQEIFERQRAMRLRLHEWLTRHFKNPTYGLTDAAFLGLEPGKPFEVHMARLAYRSSPDGGVATQLLIGLLQTTKLPVDENDPAGPKMVFEGGSTIIVDLRKQKVRYVIRKRLNSTTRLERQRQFAIREFDSLRSTYLDERPLGRIEQTREPFALIHRGG